LPINGEKKIDSKISIIWFSQQWKLSLSDCSSSGEVEVAVVVSPNRAGENDDDGGPFFYLEFAFLMDKRKEETTKNRKKLGLCCEVELVLSSKIKTNPLFFELIINKCFCGFLLSDHNTQHHLCSYNRNCEASRHSISTESDSEE